MYDTSLINSGFTLRNPGHFSERVFQMAKIGLDIEDEVSPEREPEPDMPDSEETVVEDPAVEEEMEQID